MYVAKLTEAEPAMDSESNTLEGVTFLMGWFAAVFVIIYFGITVFCAKRYYLRRHGVTARQGEPGTATAGLIGWLWPASLWFEAVRNPTFCGHHRHILARERIRQEIAAVQQLKRLEQS
jgi:hypothetical protein